MKTLSRTLVSMEDIGTYNWKRYWTGYKKIYEENNYFSSKP
jgi:hypothetical protein